MPWDFFTDWIPSKNSQIPLLEKKLITSALVANIVQWSWVCDVTWIKLWYHAVIIFTLGIDCDAVINVTGELLT